jgi:hypothetical protein
LRRGSKGFLPFFLFFTLIQALVFAQTGEEENSIPILFMAFSGPNAADAEQLGSAMRTELEWISRASGYTVKQSKNTLRSPPSMNGLSVADQAQHPKYLVNGIITREGEDSVVDISLWNLEGPALLFSQAFDYRRLDEALSMMPFYTWSLYAILPVLETPSGELQTVRAEADAEAARAEADAARIEAETAGPGIDNATTTAWKSRWIYLGLKGGISPRFYIFEADFPKDLVFTWEVGLLAEFQFLRFPWGRRNVFLALQGEGILTVDKFNLLDTDDNVTENIFFSIMMPLFLKLNYKPGPFALSLYGGMYHIWYLPAKSSGEETVQPKLRTNSFFDSLGYSAGFKFGVKAGKRGTFFFDLRYSSDRDVTEVESVTPISYQRYTPSITLGYELGLFNRK